ncbi:hypothetical protein [Streptomyces sp. NPDC002547]
MSEMAPEAQVVPDLEKILQAPVVTFLATVERVELGDVVDSVDGLVHVREICRRRYLWDLAGDPPGHIHHDRRGTDEIAPLICRTVPFTHTVRVRRAVTAFSPLKGHSKNVHSHAPVRRGWYTDPGGYDAACSCGWSGRKVYGSRERAAYGWLEHKAGQLTDAAYVDNSALQFLATAEIAHPDLPPLPWSFKQITHGPRIGGGYAEASLDTLTVQRAREVMAAWQTLPGLDDVTLEDHHYEARTHPWGKERPGWTGLHMTANGPDRSHFVLTANIDDQDDDPCRPCGCPQRFERHAGGCPTLAAEGETS